MVQVTSPDDPSKEEVEALKKDISDFVEWHMKHGPHPASVFALQELTRLLLPHVPLATRSVFTRNLTQPVVPINDIAEWQVCSPTQSTEQAIIDRDGILERGERACRSRLAIFYRLAGRFGLFALPNGNFTATARISAANDPEAVRFLIAPCGLLPHEVTAGAFAKVEQRKVNDDSLPSFELLTVADGNTSMCAPRTVAEFHAAFYRALPQTRVVCELRTTQARAIAASRRGLAATADSQIFGKVTYLEYDEAVPEAMRNLARKAAQDELAKLLHGIIGRINVAERDTATQQTRLADLVALREEETLKLTTKVTDEDGNETTTEDEEVAHRLSELEAEIEKQAAEVAKLEAVAAEAQGEKAAFLSQFEALLAHETDRRHAERARALSSRLSASPVEGNRPQVFFVRSFGAIVCANSVEQSLYATRTLQSACVTTLSLGKLAFNSDGAAVSSAPAEEEFVTIRNDAEGGEVRLRTYELEFEVLARELDAAGSQTGYLYRLPFPLTVGHRSERPAEMNEIEIPPVPQRFAAADDDANDSGSEPPATGNKARVEYRATPSVFHRQETDVPGSGRKLIRWISESGAERSAAGTVYRVDAPHAAFAPPGDVRTLIANRARVRDAYYNDTITAGPQSRFESETEWDEAARRKDAVLSGRVDTTLVVGAASRGVLLKDAIASGNAATVYYAPNPFQQPSAADRELRRYLKAQHVQLPLDASGFLDERDDAGGADSTDELDTVKADTLPKRRASATGGLLAAPIAIGSNPLAAAAAQRAAELNEKRRLAAQSESASVSASPAAGPGSSSTHLEPSMVQSSIATSSSMNEPQAAAVAAAGKSMTLPAGVTQAQVEAAVRAEKKKKRGGLMGFFRKKK